MRLGEIKKILEVETIVDGEHDLEVRTGCGSDLLSDVLAFCGEKTLLLTGLTNPQVIRTAEMVGIRVVIFVRGKHPLEETISMAIEKNIALYSCCKSLFACCGLLYERGIKPEKIKKLK